MYMCMVLLLSLFDSCVHVLYLSSWLMGKGLNQHLSTLYKLLNINEGCIVAKPPHVHISCSTLLLIRDD